MDFKTITTEIMARLKLSEQQLADMVGVKQPTIHRLKTGETVNPGWDLGKALADLHADLPEMVAREEEQRTA